jgi:hypothetical protein
VGSAVDGAGDEVRGVVGGDGDVDAAVDGLRDEAGAVPGIALERDVNAAVDGGGLDVAAEIAQREAAVAGLSCAAMWRGTRSLKLTDQFPTARCGPSAWMVPSVMTCTSCRMDAT